MPDTGDVRRPKKDFNFFSSKLSKSDHKLTALERELADNKSILDNLTPADRQRSILEAYSSSLASPEGTYSAIRRLENEVAERKDALNGQALQMTSSVRDAQSKADRAWYSWYKGQVDRKFEEELYSKLSKSDPQSNLLPLARRLRPSNIPQGY